MTMKRIFDIYFEELHQCIKDLGVMVFFILVPMGYPILYSYIYSHEVVRNIPIAVCNMSNSSEGRSFAQKVDASPEVAIKRYCSNFLEAKELMAENKVKGIVYIPHEFGKMLNRGEQAHVSIYCSMASLFYYKAMLIACTEVSISMNKEIQKKMLRGDTERQAEVAVSPLRFEAVNIANSTTGFANFVIPAILVLILQQTLLLGIGMRMGSDRERGVPIKAESTSGTLAMLAGRSAAYFTIYIPVTAYVLCVVPAIFSLSQLSRPLVLATFMLPFLLACIFLAVSAGHLVRERESSMLLFVFTSVPFLFLSGISWPESSVPPFWKAVSYLLPSTPGINGFVSINETGATLSDVIKDYRLLWTQAVVYGFIAFFTTKKR